MPTEAMMGHPMLLISLNYFPFTSKKPLLPVTFRMLHVSFN